MYLAEKIVYACCLPIILLALTGSQRTRVVISHGGQALLLKGWLSNGKWILPGGGMHQAEKPIDAAVREVFEETGLKLMPTDMKQKQSIKIKMFMITFDAVFFEVHVPDKPFLQLQRGEIKSHGWFNTQQIMNLPMNKYEKQALLSLMATTDNATIK